MSSFLVSPVHMKATAEILVQFCPTLNVEDTFNQLYQINANDVHARYGDDMVWWTPFQADATPGCVEYPFASVKTEQFFSSARLAVLNHADKAKVLRCYLYQSFDNIEENDEIQKVRHTVTNATRFFTGLAEDAGEPESNIWELE